jgi:hypothetical protein
MKFVVATLLTGLLAFVAGIFLPWWALALVAFGVALLVRQNNGPSFLAGFSGVFLMWAVVAAWIDWQNKSLLSQKIAQLFPLGGSSLLLILVAAFVGGLVGGFAALSGSLLRRLLKQKETGLDEGMVAE